MPTREALATQLNTFFSEKGLSRTGLKEGNTLNVDKLINDLVEQLKEMEHTYGVTRSPRSEIEEAGRQIKTVSRRSRVTRVRVSALIRRCSDILAKRYLNGKWVYLFSFNVNKSGWNNMV